MFSNIDNSAQKLASKAFTLAEVMVVVIIVGIAAAMVVPMMGETGDLESASAARVLLSDIEYAQSLAMVTQEEISVVFDSGAESYQLEDSSGTVLTHPISKDSYSLSFPASRYPDVEINQADFDGTAKVTFDSLGSPDSAGHIILLAGSIGRRIDVAAVTGKTSVSVVP